MRWLILNTNYPEFTRWLYGRRPGLDRRPYQEQFQACVSSLFGVADFYSRNLVALGEEARDVIANIAPLQRRWARERALPCGHDRRWQLKFRRGVVPWVYRQDQRRQLYDILEAQVRAYQPDILYCMAIEFVDSAFLRRVKEHYRLAVGQHAAELPPVDLSEYDLMLSSLPNQVQHFRRQGLASEHFRLGFEPRVLEHLNGRVPCYDIAFVGGVSGVHDPGTRVLMHLCEQCDVRIWGYGAENLPVDSPTRRRCHPPIWGRDMLEVFRQSKIVFNRHSQVAGPYANNMRLYEATGVGTMLLTDHKSNLAELFEPGREVVVYRDAEECVDLARYYLAHDEEREAIARAGQARTLREHSYGQRMAELIQIVRKYL